VTRGVCAPLMYASKSRRLSPGRGALSAWPLWSGLPLWSRSLQSAGHLVRLLRIFLGRAPEEEAAGDFADGDRNAERCGHAEDAVFHGVRVYAFRERHVGGGGAERLDFLCEGVLQLGIHAGPAAHPASLVERHIFKCNGRELLGHQRSSARLKGNKKKEAPGATAQGTSELDSLVARVHHNSADTV
jgi:hypothetical protein